MLFGGLVVGLGIAIPVLFTGIHTQYLTYPTQVFAAASWKGFFAVSAAISWPVVVILLFSVEDSLPLSLRKPFSISQAMPWTAFSLLIRKGYVTCIFLCFFIGNVAAGGSDAVFLNWIIRWYSGNDPCKIFNPDTEARELITTYSNPQGIATCPISSGTEDKTWNQYDKYHSCTNSTMAACPYPSCLEKHGDFYGFMIW
jgi:hypothetical protein